MRKEFEHHSGVKGMTVDCGDYTVEISKNIQNVGLDGTGLGNAIKFTSKLNNSAVTPFAFIIDWDEVKDGGKITLKQRDRWGCEMIFIHHDPTPLKSMFDFLAKGYNIYDGLIKDKKQFELNKQVVEIGETHHDKLVCTGNTLNQKCGCCEENTNTAIYVEHDTKLFDKDLAVCSECYILIADYWSENKPNKISPI